MANGSLLALIDDIVSLLDDVAAQSKVATSKTVGVLGDDLALNAQQVAGVRAEREIPVVLAVAKGSLLNKAILIPVAMLISAFAPWAITPLLMVGGAYLCFEGAEKVFHKFTHHAEADDKQARAEALADPKVDMVAFEKEKIRGAIVTDGVLSAELMTLALATVAGEPLLEQFLTLVVVSLILTVFVYGFVALIVRMDDVGYRLAAAPRASVQAVGRGLLWGAPVVMKVLAVVGTAAMFLVGGQIYVGGIPALHHLSNVIHETAAALPFAGWLLAAISGPLIDGAIGLAVGAALVGVLALGRLCIGQRTAHP